MPFSAFPHTADLGLRIQARDLDGLFAEAAAALFSVLVENPEAIRPAQSFALRVESGSLDFLLRDWLDELLVLFETKGVLLGEFEVAVRGEVLEAQARGEPVDRDRHRLDHEVKAITYHDLDVRRTAEGWEAQVILDI